MPGITGWAGHAQAPDTVLAAMVEGLAPHAYTATARTTANSHSALAAAAVAELGDGLRAGVSGSPRWSEPALQHIAEAQGDARALAEAYRRYGTELLQYLRGAFTVVVVDAASDRTLAAIDRLGQHSLYYAVLSDALLFGSSADSIRAHPGFTARFSPQAIFDYVYYHMVPAPGAIYQGMHKLLGGHYLEYRNGEARTVCYWQPAFDEHADTNALGEELRRRLQEAVREKLNGAKTGAFLSGGLDSSTVAGLLAKLRPAAAPAYSIGFDAEGYDEMAYARIAARHFHNDHHEYYVTPDDVVAAVPTIARSYGEPFGNSSALPVYYCARMAMANGTACLLAGDGGDELFAGNERYRKQALFELYGTLPRPLQRLVNGASARLPAGVPVVSKIRSYVQQANVPLPDRLDTYNFTQRIAIDAIFSGDFSAGIDPHHPLALKREIYQRPPQASALNRMLYLDWQQTLADNDLRKVNQMCALNGVEVHYPFLDDEVVELSCRIPSKLKLKGQQLRYFYKQALAQFLPAEIIGKSKHGFGLPFGLWMRTHRPLQELAYDSLLALKRRDYFRPEFLDQAVALHRGGHAAYYGELIWILMMLELWLASRSP